MVFYFKSEGNSFQFPRPGDNVHSHLRHAKRPMAVRGGGGGGGGGLTMAVFRGRSGIFVLKLKKKCIKL